MRKGWGSEKVYVITAALVIAVPFSINITSGFFGHITLFSLKYLVPVSEKRHQKLFILCVHPNAFAILYFSRCQIMRR